MRPALYDQLTPWYSMIDPVSDHEEEAREHQQAVERAISGRAESLLELGAGAGNNAYYLKHRFTCTLTDVSEAMLGLSRQQNPECEHVLGDMRALRLDRTFDAVLVHDAIVYMTTEADLQAAVQTAFVHTRAGGAAVIAPDCFAETFAEGTQLIEGNDGARALRCIEWTWASDQNPETCWVDFAFMLRDGDEVRVVHDRHLEGLFSKSKWIRVLSEVGFEVEMMPRSVEDGHGYTDEIFICRRP